MQQFVIDYEDRKLHVQEMFLAGSVLFRLETGSGFILLTRAQKPDGNWFWTSIPQGRQKEAELFGPLIEMKLRS